MDQRPKAKVKRNGPKNTDKKQSERFIEAAQELTADSEQNAKTFEKTFKKILPPKASHPQNK